jgi:hypothetical protein
MISGFSSANYGKFSEIIVMQHFSERRNAQRRSVDENVNH